MAYIQPYTIKGGGGPEDDPVLRQKMLIAQVFIPLVFGLAMGITLLLLHLALKELNFLGIESLQCSFGSVNPLLSLLAGFAGGFVIAVIYNFLMLQRHAVFGMESTVE